MPWILCGYWWLDFSSLAFYVIGFGLMFGNGNPFWGMEGLFALAGPDTSPATVDAYKGAYAALSWTGVPLAAKFFFQLVFCGTAATIVSGAVAERIMFKVFIFFTILIAMVIYPIGGHWIWGGGWLAELGMFDFAGSTMVHSVGGWSALAGIILLGPRLGKYKLDGSAKPIYGHNLSIATLGVFVLWFGWFGFNPGSTMALNPDAIAHIAVTANSAASAASLSATLTAWLLLGKPDLSMILNGCLAGLVAITFDKIKIDDPVGALSVHLVNGIFGTLGIGLFADKEIAAKIGTDAESLSNGLFAGGGFHQLSVQFIGVISVGAFVFLLALLSWSLLKKTMGIRVSKEEELMGLDIGEHGMEAYNGFQVFTNM